MSYSINVPPSASEQWRVSYYCSDCDGYVEQGYYTSTGTEVEQNSADLLTGGQNHTNIDLQLVVANSISGTISLPSGTVAPSGGLQVELNASGDMNGLSGSASVSIDAGQSSATYSINVPPSASEQWRVSYSCYGCDGYVEQGYYTSTGTEVDYNSADLLTGGQNHTNIDLQLVVANSISGTISLPSGTVAPSGGLEVQLNAIGSRDSPFDTVIIDAGQSSATYSIDVPPLASEQWKVGYLCYDCDGYVENGYYTSIGTEVEQDSADLLAGGHDYTSIDFELIVANSISGTISLPSGSVAPSGGLPIELSASSNTSGLYASKTVIIGAGQSSASYSIDVPPLASEQWRIGYLCYSCDGYVRNAYYSSMGTKLIENSAEQLSGGQDYAGIDLQLIVANSISGIISLPSGSVAPIGGLQVNLNASSDISGLYAPKTVIIDVGQSSASYSIDVPPLASEQWRVSYSCYGCDGYASQGYYASTGTEFEQSAADLLAGGQNHTSIDWQLILANTILGSVSLPNGSVAPYGGVSVEVSAFSDVSSLYIQQFVTIESGQSSVSYGIEVPSSASEQWRVGYFCSVCDGYLSQGYYSSTGTEVESSSANLLTGGQNHTSIDLQLIVANSISGTISLPIGSVAPSGGLQFNLNASSDISGLSGSASVTIGAGQSSASYSIDVPSSVLEQWRVSYSCSDCDGYVEHGYYTSTGTEVELSSADLLAGGQNYVGINLQLITTNTVAGFVILPSGTTAPSGGIGVNVILSNTVGGSDISSYVVISEGETSASYLIEIPHDVSFQWQVHYSCNLGCSAYVDEAYYSVNSTTTDQSLATALSGDQDYSNIDLQLLSNADADNDGYIDSQDNCPAVPNEDQLDSDDNGIGDACETEDECTFFTIKTQSNSAVVICL